MLSMCKISTIQDILQWLHREEFPEDIAKLQSGDVTTRSRDTGGTVHVKRSKSTMFIGHLPRSWY